MQHPASKLFCALVTVVALGVSSNTRAQAPQQLYDEGLKDMLAGQFEVGCPKIERSYGLDPLPGALFTLAACYARWGKTHSAVLRYQEFLGKVATLPQAERDEQQQRVVTASEKLIAMQPQVPHLTLDLDPSLPADTQVEMDGTVVAPATLGLAQPVDPGEHRFVVRTADGRMAEQVEHIQAGSSQRVTLQAPGEVAPVAPLEPDEPDEGGDFLFPMKTWALIAGGVGVAGIVVGGVTGGLVFAKKGDVEDNCADQVCNQDGKDAADSAATLGMVSNVTFAVGIVGLAAGTALWFLAPDDEAAGEEQAMRVTIGGAPGDLASATLGVSGTW
ncbi:MAG: hypothetical protein JRI68_18295 [Deltaproteobacteria bacterium]|nr:hypothetical protein [Deltaproteobacteria bacterium]